MLAKRKKIRNENRKEIHIHILYTPIYKSIKFLQ